MGEGIAAENPPQGKEPALQGSILFNRLDGIIRTGGNIRAVIPLVGRDMLLIPVNTGNH